MIFKKFTTVLTFSVLAFKCNASALEESSITSVSNFAEPYKLREESFQLSNIEKSPSKLVDHRTMDYFMSPQAATALDNFMNFMIRLIEKNRNSSQPLTKDHLIIIFKQLSPQAQRNLFSGLAFLIQDKLDIFESCFSQEMLKQAIESLVYYGGSKPLVLLKNENGNRPDKAHFVDLSNDIISLLTEFVGSYNCLPIALKQLKKDFDKASSFKYLAATRSGFEWVKNCNLSLADYNSLIRLPKFNDEFEKFLFFIEELLLDKYKSIAAPLITYLLDFYKTLLDPRMRPSLINMILYIFRTNYDIRNLVKLASIHPDGAVLFFSFLTFDELKAFFLNAPIGFIESIETENTKTQAIIYSIIAGAPNSSCPLISENYDFKMKQSFSLIFISAFKYYSNTEALENFEAFINSLFHSRQTEEEESLYLLLDSYLKNFQGKLSEDEIVERISSLLIADELKVFSALIMAYAKKIQLAKKIIGTDSGKIQHYIQFLIHPMSNISLNYNCRQEAIKFFNGLSVLSEISEKAPIDHRSTERILDTLFMFYQVESMKISETAIKLNCAPIPKNEIIFIINGVKVLFPQLFTAPLSITISKNCLIPLVRTINTMNEKILESLILLAFKNPSFKSDNRISESFILAAQKSEEFNQILFESPDSSPLFMNCERLLEVYKFPINRIIGKIYICFSKVKFLSKAYEFESALAISMISCLELYQQMSNNSSFSTSRQILESRSFFVYWIESDQWTSLTDTQNNALLDFLAGDYPHKVSIIRKNHVSY